MELDPLNPDSFIHIEITSKQDYWIVRKFFDYLWKQGPLGTARRVNEVTRGCFNRMIPGCNRLFLSIDRLLCIVEHYFDSSFDRKAGTDTSGVIPLKDLTIGSKDVKECGWYEPISVKIFKRIMNYLTINFSEFEFIDFGCGKGRVLLLASDYGFKRIIGVEFARELHRIATENVVVWERYTQKPSNIEVIHMDAAEFSIPKVSVVIFFFSPFGGKVMEQVLKNVSTSFAMNPREIIIIFYGRNPKSIELLKATKFQCREIELRADWSRFIHYRGFLFTSLGERTRKIA